MHGGRLTQGEYDIYAVGVAPAGSGCAGEPKERSYQATVAYYPPEDTVTLTVNSEVVVGQNGVAHLAFTKESSGCDGFVVRLDGTAIGQVARYVLTASHDEVCKLPTGC